MTTQAAKMDSAAGPDFEKLRAERNARMEAFEEEMRAKGFEIVAHCARHRKDACYCACGSGGPCEHKWDGEEWISEDGCASSATCSRCGMTAMSHDLHRA